jgi:hypothetical protein
LFSLTHDASFSAFTHSQHARVRALPQDVRLEAPIAVRGRVVHWIDSKASFADPLVHREKARTHTRMGTLKHAC